MKLLKSTAVATALTLTASLAAPAFGSEPKFSSADVQKIFGQEASPLQAAALSETEMEETEGAWLQNIVAFTALGAIGGGVGYMAVTPYSNWTWSDGGRAVGAGATAGFYNSTLPIRAFGTYGSIVLSGIGAASWYQP